ncbi:MAG: ABC transporter permease, partial [Armatimonadota bacterium]
LPYAGIIGNARYAGNHEPTLLTVLFLGLIIGGAVVGRYIAPALTAPLVARERERRTLQQVAVTPVSPRQVLSGKVWATSLPLAVPFMVLAPCVGLLCGIAGQFNPMETLGYLGFMFAEILVGIYGSLAFSCLCRKTANAVAGGYVLVWTLGPALLIGMMLIAEWHNYYGREAERMVVALAFAVEFAVALAAWLVARATLRRLMAS